MAGMNTPFSFFATATAAFALFATLLYFVAPVELSVALVVSSAAFVGVSLLLLLGPLKGRGTWLRSLAVLGAQCVLVAAIVVVMATGGFGFSQRVPAPDEVRSVEVSYVGTPSYLARTLSGTASDSSYYYHAEYRFDDDEALPIIASAHSKLIDAAGAELQLDTTDFAATPLRYDVVLRYTLLDGSTLVRYYDRARISDLAVLLTLDDTARIRELERAVLTGDDGTLGEEDRAALGNASAALAYRIGSIYVADANYNGIVEVQCSQDERDALLAALATDVAAQSSQERYTQSARPLATLMFTNAPAFDAERFGFSFANALIPLSASFTNTLAWFESNGLADCLSQATGGVDPALIESMVFMRDDPYASVVSAAVPQSRFFLAYRSNVPGRFWTASDFGTPLSTREADEIADVAPHLKTACFMDGGLLVQVKLRGIDAYVYYYLRTADVPDYLSMGGM
jgi:ABC-2 type transport system permease protein